MPNAMRTVVQRKHATRRVGLKRRLRFLLQENAPACVLHLAEGLLFFFLSLSECFEMPSPFAVCALGAFIMSKRRLLFPAFGLAFSLALRAVWGVGMDTWQYIGCGLLAFSALKRPRTANGMSIAVTAVLSLRFIPLIFFPATQKDMALCLVSVLVGTLCTPAFCHALRLTHRRLTRIGLDDMLCCLVLCAALLCGAGRVVIGQMNIGFSLTGAAILLCASVGGCTAAVCAGLIGGISLSICGHADGYVVCFAFSGIVCGLFYGRKRGILCAVYLLCCAFTSYAVHFCLDIPFISAAFMACGGFLLIPRNGISAAFLLARRLSPDTSDNENAYVQHMRAQWTGNLRALAALLPEVRMTPPDAQEQTEDIMERLCTGCDRMPICWGEHIEDTKALFTTYFIDGDRTVRMRDCLRREAWPALAIDYERSKQQHALRLGYLQREREATRTHLSAIAQAMGRLSVESLQCDKDDDILLGEAAYLLRQMRISGRILYALRVSQHISLALRYEPQLTRTRQLDRYCQELSACLGRSLHIAQRSKDMILIEETPPLMVDCYHLSASSGDGSGENGDSVLLRTGRGGREISMLSDGMGHGEQAHEESEKTLELLSLCLDAGYTVEAAFNAINCIMLSATDGEQYATVDLCVTDLWSGQATLYKLGACPSVLIAGGSMRVIQSGTLPLGILPDVKASSHTFSVADGDMLIQFSDGLSDACGGMHALEGQISLLVRNKLERSPETICTALMSAAMRRCGGVPPDDMTVLCVSFKNKQKREGAS